MRVAILAIAAAIIIPASGCNDRSDEERALQQENDHLKVMNSHLNQQVQQLTQEVLRNREANYSLGHSLAEAQQQNSKLATKLDSTSQQLEMVQRDLRVQSQHASSAAVTSPASPGGTPPLVAPYRPQLPPGKSSTSGPSDATVDAMRTKMLADLDQQIAEARFELRKAQNAAKGPNRGPQWEANVVRELVQRRETLARVPLDQLRQQIASQIAKDSKRRELAESLPVSSLALAHIRDLIADGAKANEIESDPYIREAAKNDPELRALIEEAARRNGR